jgi:cbb3-type cytochrome oxidase maturation protein
MSILYILIPIAVVFVFVAIALFVWAVRSNQFEDLERHGSDILFEDSVKPKNIKPAKKSADD